MNHFFVLTILIFGAIFTQIALAETDSKVIGPQRYSLEISTDKPVYHYAYYQGGHEKIRIFLKIPQIIPNEKVEIRSVYTRGPHTFTDTYSICSESIMTNCFANQGSNVYFLDSDRNYGTLFGKWALGVKYAGQINATAFEITTLNKFEVDAARQQYTVKDLKDVGLHLAFLGSEVSDQTNLDLEIFKIEKNGQKLVLKQNVPIEIVADPPYFNILPITFPNKVPFDVGQYNITARWGDLFDSDTFEVIEPTISDESKVTNQPTENPKSGCLIATAAFGSDLAPQVQFLREYRDNTIMATAAGSNFIMAFNVIYYSFSPTVADFERNNIFLQEILRNALYPLIWILELSQIAAIFGGEAGVLSAGLISGMLIGIVYFWPLTLKFNFLRIYRKIIFSLIASVVAISSGLVFDNAIILMISTMVFVVSSAIFGITLVSKALNLVKIQK